MGAPTEAAAQPPTAGASPKSGLKKPTGAETSGYAKVKSSSKGATVAGGADSDEPAAKAISSTNGATADGGQKKETTVTAKTAPTRADASRKSVLFTVTMGAPTEAAAKPSPSAGASPMHGLKKSTGAKSSGEVSNLTAEGKGGSSPKSAKTAGAGGDGLAAMGDNAVKAGAVPAPAPYRPDASPKVLFTVTMGVPRDAAAKPSPSIGASPKSGRKTLAGVETSGGGSRVAAERKVDSYPKIATAAGAAESGLAAEGNIAVKAGAVQAPVASRDATKGNGGTQNADNNKPSWSPMGTPSGTGGPGDHSFFFFFAAANHRNPACLPACPTRATPDAIPCTVAHIAPYGLRGSHCCGSNALVVHNCPPRVRARCRLCSYQGWTLVSSVNENSLETSVAAFAPRTSSGDGVCRW